LKIGGDRLRRDASDPQRLVWLLVTGELITPRGQPGPLARHWAARGPAGLRPRADRRERSGDQERRG
jgi:hypothetical protein